MTTLKKIITGSCLALAMACGSKKDMSSSQNNSMKKDTGSPDSKEQTDDASLIKATVVDQSEIAGCTYLLQLSTGEKLQPENLAAEFQKNDLSVLIKYRLTQMNTACMAGPTAFIEIIKVNPDSIR